MPTWYRIGMMIIPAIPGVTGIYVFVGLLCM